MGMSKTGFIIALSSKCQLPRPGDGVRHTLTPRPRLIQARKPVSCATLHPGAGARGSKESESPLDPVRVIGSHTLYRPAVSSLSCQPCHHGGHSWFSVEGSCAGRMDSRTDPDEAPGRARDGLRGDHLQSGRGEASRVDREPALRNHARAVECGDAAGGASLRRRRSRRAAVGDHRAPARRRLRPVAGGAPPVDRRLAARAG